MDKTNVIVIGDFNPWAVNRKFSKLENRNNQFVGVLYIASCNLSKDNESVNEKMFNRFKQTIDSDETMAFQFENYETLELFDKNHYLRDRAVIIDYIDEETKAMTVEQLNSMLYKITGYGKSPKINLDEKIFLIDNQERKYFMEDMISNPLLGEVAFSIIPVPAPKPPKKKLSISDFILKKLNVIDKDRKWLAEQLGVNTQTLYGKFTRDSFDFYEILEIADILKFDLDELNSKCKRK